MANEPQEIKKESPAGEQDAAPRLKGEPEKEPLSTSRKDEPDDEFKNLDLQDNYVETKEPSELIFCVILSSIYAGLARYCWTPLESSGRWDIFINIEGFFITIALLALLLGLRPYLSPSS
ncbi:MAG: hypothetical protein K2X27_26835 [Candidatus Obscuribacterales bacterium]|nr:hypothetical protein [Candidatus Obscuribacterales bacterium]